MASKAAEFASQFVELSKKGQALEMLPDLKEVIMGVGSPGFEISTQEETAMRLKPNKMFRRVLVLMENKEAVAALVSLIIPKESTPDDAYHVMLGVLLKLSSIPSFAGEFADVPAAPAFLLFQRFLFPRLESASRRRAAWDPSYVNAASLYNQLLNNLIQHSPRFAADALDSRLIHELLRAFPFAPRPFLAWATTPEVTSVTNLASYQASTLVCLQDTNPQGPRDIRLKDLDLVGDWLDRILGFLDAFRGPLLSRGEGARFGSAAVYVLRFVDVVEGTREVNRALFTPARRAAMLLTAERVCALGKSYEAFGRQVVQTVDRAWVKMAQVAAGKDSWERDERARTSVTRAEALFDKLRTAKEDGDLWGFQLRDLHEEMQKGGLHVQDAQRLAARGLVSLLVDMLEGEDMSRERKPGLVSGTTEGPVWPALEMLVALAEPFDPANSGGNEAFCRELAEGAPRLSRFAGGGAVGALGSFEVRLLLEALFTVLRLNPDERWSARWPLLDVLLAACKRFIPTDPGSWRIWDRIADCLPFLSEPTVETRRLITLLHATPCDPLEKRERWSELMQKWRYETIEGEATWGPDAQARKLCHVALGVLDEGHAAMADLGSPVYYAAALLRFCCNFREAVRSEVVGTIGPLMAALKTAYAGMAGLVRTCEGRTPDEEEARRWEAFEGVATKLLFCIGAVLDAEPLAGGLRDAIARNGGVSFAAEVLRTRVEADRYVRKNIREDENQCGALLLLEELPGVALWLWEGLAQKYGLKMCSFQECPRDVVETRKNLFKKCSACSRVQYCSKECQAGHWKKEHKRTCGKQEGIR